MIGEQAVLVGQLPDRGVLIVNAYLRGADGQLPPSPEGQEQRRRRGQPPVEVRGGVDDIPSAFFGGLFVSRTDDSLAHAGGGCHRIELARQQGGRFGVLVEHARTAGAGLHVRTKSRALIRGSGANGVERGDRFELFVCRGH